MEIFAIYDSKAAAYLPPFFCRNSAVAKRMIASATMQEDHDMQRFGGDYTLFRLGTWDDTEGQLRQEDMMENLGTALQIRSQFETIAAGG